MIFRLQQYILDIDVEQTAAFYRTLPPISEGCHCDNCRNYQYAVKHLHENTLAFFSALGIDIAKPTEVYVNYATAEGILHYGGFYHLCGSILQGSSAWVASSETKNSKSFVWNDENTVSLDDEFRVSFQRQCDLIEDTLPFLAIQLDFTAMIPWVLDAEMP